MKAFAFVIFAAALLLIFVSQGMMISVTLNHSSPKGTVTNYFTAVIGG